MTTPEQPESQKPEWTSPYRVACDRHNEFRPVFTNGRPLLDDRCPWCLLDGLRDRAASAEDVQNELDALKRLDQAKSPCGHWQAFAESDDGGRTITCLKCRAASLEAERDALRARVAFECGARRSSCDPPQDCDWPVCGCDPKANEVLSAMEEQGFLSPKQARAAEARSQQAESALAGVQARVKVLEQSSRDVQDEIQEARDYIRTGNPTGAASVLASVFVHIPSDLRR